jgi:RimJ/RimL family protein N-acetyltransferase
MPVTSPSPHANTRPTPSQRPQALSDPLPASATRARFSLRPLCGSDRDAFRALFLRLGPESRHRRYFTGKPELSARELAYLTDVDHLRHEALAAIDRREGLIVGVARYVSWPGRVGVADVAIEIADDCQGIGIGWMLAEALIRRARSNGINVLTATALWENRAALALARRAGFRARSSAGNEVELELLLLENCAAESLGRAKTQREKQ